MNYWKQLPYPAKMAFAFFIFFVATLGFALLRAKSSHPRIPVTVLAETPLEQSNWTNKPKVVYFWATWCGVCKAYSYLLRENIKMLGKDTVFISIVEDEQSKELQQYLVDHKIQYPVFSGNYEMLKDWGISAFPTTVFLNAKDEVVFFDTGIISPISFWFRSLLMKVL
jgi:thiol-disulfide isomerase/thioredoxin